MNDNKNNQSAGSKRHILSTPQCKSKNPKSITIETVAMRKGAIKQEKKDKKGKLVSYYGESREDFIFERKETQKKDEKRGNNEYGKYHNNGYEANKTIDNFAPSGINVYDYAESRAFEIMNLRKALSSADYTKHPRVHQSLPRHMRRRAASHDLRRIPKRLREKAEREEQPKETTSRKHKRRPRNLMKEYNRRAKLHCWLETHIWHAKRFFMADKWGYRMAEKPCDKAFRAIYRASLKTCLLQDKSYMEVIEIDGRQDDIIRGFKRITNPNCINGGLLNDEDCLSGRCYAEGIIYKCNKYPYDVIGCVKFIWVPAMDRCSRKLIIISHPLISAQLMEEIECIFDVSKPQEKVIMENIGAEIISRPVNDEENEDTWKLEKDVNDSCEEKIKNTDDTLDKKENIEIMQKVNNEDPTNEKKVKDCNELKMKIIDGQLLDERGHIAILPNVKSGNDSDKLCKLAKISILHHKLDFVILSLTGPASFSILQKVFCYPETNLSDPVDTENCKMNGNSVKINDNEFWKVAHNSMVGKRSLYSLCVEDPRFHLPHRKQNPFGIQVSGNLHSKQESDQEFIIKTEEQCCLPSLLWDVSARKKVKEEKEKLCDEHINKIRSELLIPGSCLPIKSPEIPVVVMQRPGRSVHCDIEDHRNLYGSGFDLILPGGWAMPFWIAIIFQGAHVGGRNADEDISFEALSTYFPSLYPDSQARRKHIPTLQKERKDKYERYPPSKRVNYQLIGTRHPFTLPWLDLVAEWEHMIKILLPGNDAVNNMISNSSHQGYYVLREKRILNHLKDLISGDIKMENVMKALIQHPRGLVPVYITCMQNGVPKENAMLCIPTTEDIFLSNNKDPFAEKWCGPKEPVHKGYKSKFPYVCKNHDVLLPNAATIGGNTRWVLGYVQTGNYSFSIGHGVGVGFISLIGFIYLLNVRNVDKDGTKLLFRNINTLEYRLCHLHVLC